MSHVTSAIVRGLESVPVTVECRIDPGIPSMTILGMPDLTALDARARVRCAIKSAGFEVPRGRVTVSLAPSGLRKSGTGLDLAIAAAILQTSHQIPPVPDNALLVGELGLDGGVRAVRGDACHRAYAIAHGLTLVHAPGTSGGRHVENIAQLRHGVDALPDAPTPEPAIDDRPTFADLELPDSVVDALVAAAAGRHSLLLVGPDGLAARIARRLPSILPSLSDGERLTCEIVHSVAGQAAPHGRPFRAPHHSITTPGLVGGGRPVAPGEVSLAHGGVLFLDGLPDFASSTLSALRPAMQDGRVSVVRADGNYVFPAGFWLVASARPCPCGHLGDPRRECTCSARAVHEWQSRLDGVLSFDMRLDLAEAGTVGFNHTSGELRERVTDARRFAASRLAGADGEPMGADARETLETVARRAGLGGRGIRRLLRVARTVADAGGRGVIGGDDLLTALSWVNR